MSYIYWLSQIQQTEQSLVGDKLFILSQLLQLECPILPGFILERSFSNQFLADINHGELLVDHLNDLSAVSGDRALWLQSISRRSRQIISQSVIPNTWLAPIFQAAQHLNSDYLRLQPFVTIPYQQQRESQGFWKSYTCNNNSVALAQALKKVYSEFFTAKSLLYWHKLGLNIKDIDLNILIRPLQTAYASGIIELNSDLVKIQANWGLEPSLLQGDVEPDEYLLNRSTGYLLSRHLGHKNYAYRLRDLDLKTASEDCIEAYIPDASQTETYVLNQKAIAQLLQLTQVVLDRFPQIKYLVWTAPELKDSSIPHFYFTQLSDRLSTSSILLANKFTHNLAPSSLPYLLSGVAASPGNVLARTVVIKDFDSYRAAIPPDCIIVTKTISSHHIHSIKQAVGIITETGGKTSHGAIIARELNIPAIVNVVDATTILEGGVKILLDGNHGKVYPAAAKHSSLFHLPHSQTLTPNYPIATKLMVNLSQPESIANALNLPIDGVGLLRSELMLGELLTPHFLEQRREKLFRLKFSNTLTTSLRHFVDAFAPHPVFYRSIDWYARDTLNPIVGNRGTYSYIKDPDLFDLEIQALASIATEGYSNLNLILPFVRSVEEFEFCYRRLENMGLTAKKSFKVWIMAEVPSIILLLPEYIRAGVQGIAIGTNDLTQLLLGVNRERAEFAELGLNANHLAMHRAISQLISTAKAHNIECCICGQAPVEHPDLIDKLIEWGIDAISVEPEAVARTYQAIARTERKILLEHRADRSSLRVTSDENEKF